MDEDTGFEPISAGGDYGEPSVSSRELAQAAAAEALRSTSMRPGESFRDAAAVSEEHLTAQFKEQVQGEETASDVIADVGTEGAEGEGELVPILTEEEVEALVTFGVEVPTEVPVGFEDSYARLAQSTLQVTREAEARVQEAQHQAMELAEQMRDLRARLSTPEGQRRLLLTLGLSAPELFNQARETVDRMSRDPEYADMVRGRLEADARLEAADRRERAFAAAQNQTKGRQIEDHTTRLAGRLGVDTGIAKEMVAARILQNEATNGKRDISIREVDEIVSNLAKRVGRPKSPVKAPAAQKKVQQAPQKPASAAGREPAAPQPPARQPVGPTNTDPMDALRSAVRGAGQRLRSKGL